jgi:hypothetical protein
MVVDVDKGVEVPAKSVGELRKMMAWPENLVIATPMSAIPKARSR